MNRACALFFCCCILALGLGCGGGREAVPAPPPATLSSIAITPATLTLPLGTTTKLTATGVYSDGTTKDLSATVSWVSSAPLVLTVDALGNARALTQGSASVQASSGTVKATVSAVVSGPALLSLRVLPNAISVPYGDFARLRALGTYTDSVERDLSKTVTWQSTDTNVRVGGNGYVVALGIANAATITAKQVGFTANATVTSESPILESTLHPLDLPEQYIWLGATAAETESRFFRASLDLATIPKQATLYVAGPRTARVFVNGQLVTEQTSGDDYFRREGVVVRADVLSFLHPGHNIVTIEALGGSAMAAKLVPAEPAVDAPAILISNNQWKAALQAPLGWEQPTFDDSLWQNATALMSIDSDEQRREGNIDRDMYKWPGYDGIAPFLARRKRLAATATDTSTSPGMISGLDQFNAGGGASALSITIPSVSGSPQPTLLVDFGDEISGRLSLHSLANAPVNISVQYGESAGEAQNNPHLGPQDIVLPAGLTVFGAKAGFRFAQLKFVSGPPTASIEVAADEIYTPTIFRGWFESSDPLLDQIWMTGARTVHRDMQDRLWDGIKRDRLRWSGDSHIIARVSSKVYGFVPIVQTTVDELGTSAGHNNVNNIPGYSALWLMTQAEQYRMFGDSNHLASLHQTLLDQMENIATQFDADGLFRFPAGSFPFFDWSLGLHTDLTGDEAWVGTHFELISGLHEGAWMLGELGDTANAQRFEALATSATNVAQQYLVSTSTNTFGTRHQVNSMAILANAATPEQQVAIWNSILSQPSPSEITPFMNYYMMEAMAKTGHQREALDYIRTYWGGMLAEGATTFWETYDLRWPKEDFHRFLKIGDSQDFIDNYFVSLCHGWSAGPTAWMTDHIIGVSPLSPGASTVRIRPDLLDLTFARGVVPTNLGDITVDYSASPVFTAKVQLPPGMTAQFEAPVAGPSSTILVNGTPVQPTQHPSPNRATIVLNGPGVFTVSVQP